jgi:hypothetical protein
MCKLRLFLIAIRLAVLCVHVYAQPDDLSTESKVTDAEIQAWLRSGEPRLVAWGAYFARVHGDAAAVEPMAELLEQWTPADNQDADAGAQNDAMADVLDALIVRHGRASVEGLTAIASSFPDQAAILESRLPIKEATPVLLAWYEKRNSDAHLLPRIAAMLLSKAPPPGFAASVLAEFEERVRVTVVSGDYGVGYGGSYSTSCGDGFGRGIPPGWPPLFSYGVEENKAATHDPVLVRAGGDTITYHRIDQHTGWGTCFDPHPLNASTRAHLFVEMLGKDAKSTSWAVDKNDNIPWEGSDHFLHALQGLIDEEEGNLHGLAEDLFMHNDLSRDEADSVRPRLTVTIFDDRAAGSPPLPKLEPSDARTTLVYQAK